MRSRLLLLLLLSVTRIVGSFDSSVVAVILQLLLLLHEALSSGFGGGLLTGIGNIHEDGAAAWSVFDALPTDLSNFHGDGLVDAIVGIGRMGSAAMKPVLLLLLLADSNAQTGNGGG